MASLFEIGKTGVQAYRQALSVTGQNIANINTEGYNKRRADVSEVAGVTGGPTNVSDQSGLGVRVTNVRRSFDEYLADKRKHRVRCKRLPWSDRSPLPSPALALNLASIPITYPAHIPDPRRVVRRKPNRQSP